MSSDADAHKVGLIPVTLMVSGNIMGSGVFLLPANLAATGGLSNERAVLAGMLDR